MNSHHNELSREFFVAEVQRVISKVPFLSQSVNSFLLYFCEENFIRKKLECCFELREKVSYIELGLIQREVSKQIIVELERLGHGFSKILQNLTGSTEPAICFYSLGEGPFKLAAGLARRKISVKLNY